MKPIVLVVATVLCLSACSSAFISKNRENLTRLKPRMTKDEVHSVMGRDSVKWYTNPHRTAMFLGDDGKAVEVFYYWTDHTADRGIPDRDLTPIVFPTARWSGGGASFGRSS